MGLRDILKKKDKIEGSDVNRRDEAVNRLAAPEFTFMRSDTHTQEIIHPPSDPNDAHGSYENINYLSAADAQPQSSPTSTGGGGGGGGGGAGSRPRRLSDVFGSLSRNSSTSSRNGAEKASTSKPSRRLTQKLHLSRAPASSENVPANLPEIIIPQDGPDADRDGTESQWERRATILAKTAGENEAVYRSRPHTPTDGEVGEKAPLSREFAGLQIQGNSEAKPVASSPAIDADIQQAIRLHEEGELEKSTTLFAKLADPNGANNPLSQVLYGLALRHGWGCEPNPEKAVFYLSSAAKNAATVESLALQAGLKKGGAAKGELVLAIFELANCFRHGWGIEKDSVAAKQYYETAANLGDTDAMNEVAWCYLEGFGCKKDKYASAKYYQLAEKNGNKTIGNTWIWKDKYSPENGKKSKK